MDTSNIYIIFTVFQAPILCVVRSNEETHDTNFAKYQNVQQEIF